MPFRFDAVQRSLIITLFFILFSLFHLKPRALIIYYFLPLNCQVRRAKVTPLTTNGEKKKKKCRLQGADAVWLPMKSHGTSTSYFSWHSNFFIWFFFFYFKKLIARSWVTLVARHWPDVGSCERRESFRRDTARVQIQGHASSPRYMYEATNNTPV